MKNNYIIGITVVLILLSVASHGQTVIKSIVVDQSTGLGLPYVNVGFVDRGIGTLSDENGVFELTFNETLLKEEDFFQISIVGYETRILLLKELKAIIQRENVIYLKAAPLSLDEVFIEELFKDKTVIGYSEYTKVHFGYWKEKDGLGGEIATRIRIKKKRTKLINLNFKIIENEADSVLIRINIYDYNKKYPQKKIVNSQIYHTITKNITNVSIDLDLYDIIVDDDVVVGIELIKVHGDVLGLALAGSSKRAISFTRAISQDKWQRYNSKGVAFSVKVGRLKSKFHELF